MGFRRGFKTEANKIALSVRKKMGLKSTDPVDPQKICDYFEIEVIKLSNLECDAEAFLNEEDSVFSAVTVPHGIETAIVHNDSHNKYRQRSNICHELGHCFLGHTFMPPLTEKGERNRDSGVEGEANFLGGCLLIPNEAAIYILRNALKGKAQNIYGVSSSMLEWRLRMSGAYKIMKRRRKHW